MLIRIGDVVVNPNEILNMGLEVQVTDKYLSVLVINFKNNVKTLRVNCVDKTDALDMMDKIVLASTH